MQHNQTMSGGAFAELQASEKLVLKAYRDPGGVPTIGWGHTKGVVMGVVITRAQAVTMLEHDLTDTYAVIDELVTVPLSQGQFDGLSDFVFNIGGGQFKGSTMRALLNARNYVAAGDELIRWKFDNGRILDGLAIRRGREFIRWYS